VAGLTFVGLAAGNAGRARAASAADDAATASLKKHYEQGAKYYNIGKYDEAIKEFEAAYEAKPDPLILYNLAQAHRLAGHNTEALRIYKNHLRAMPDSPYLADVQKHIAALEEATKNEPPPQPPATGGPVTPPPPGTSPTTTPGGTQGTGAPVTLPGTPPPTTQPPPGPGDSGGPPPTYPPVETTPPPAPADAGGMAPPPPMLEQPGPAPKPGLSGRQKVGIVIAAIGAGSLLLGGVFGAIAKSSEKKIETASDNYDAFDPSVDKLGRASEKAEFVFLGVGLAAAITGTVVYMTAPKAETESPQPMSPPPTPAMGPVSFLPSVSPRGAGALLRMSF
jgi:hypothetical protein